MRGGWDPGVYTPGYALSPAFGGFGGWGVETGGGCGVGRDPWVYTPGYALSPAGGGLGLGELAPFFNPPQAGYVPFSLWIPLGWGTSGVSSVQVAPISRMARKSVGW